MTDSSPAIVECPLRPTNECSACGPGATDPDDCGLVYLVMTDPDLKREWAERRRKRLAAI